MTKNSKFSRFLKSFNLHCEKHSEFDGSCTNCWLKINDKVLSAGGHKSKGGMAILKTISFASKLEEDEWKPQYGIGEWKDKDNCHNMGWSRELFEERKEIFNKYYGVKK